MKKQRKVRIPPCPKCGGRVFVYNVRENVLVCYKCGARVKV